MSTTWTADFATDTLSVFDSTSVSGGTLEVSGGRLHSLVDAEGEYAYGTKDVFGAIGAVDVAYLRLYVKETSGEIPNANYLKLVQFLDTAGVDMGTLYLTSSLNGIERRVIFFGAGWTSGSPTVSLLRTIGLDTWHLVEFYFDSRLQGVVGKMDGTWNNARSFGNGDSGQTLRYLRFGCQEPGGVGQPDFVGNVYMDHLYVSDDIAASWPGPHAESGMPARAATFFLDGYETGSIVGLDTGSFVAPTIQTDIVRNGNYALKFAHASAATGIQGVSTRVPTTSELSLRMAVYFQSFPSSTPVPFFRALTNGSKTSQLTISSAGVVVGDMDISDASSVTGPTLSTGEWYAFDASFKWFDGTWTLDWRVRPEVGGIWEDLTSEVITGSLDYLSTWRVGLLTNPQGANMRHDDLMLSMSAADFPQDKGAILAVRPVMDGTHYLEGDFEQTTDNAATFQIISPSSFDRINDMPLVDIGASADAIAQFVDGAEAYLEYLFSSPITAFTAVASQLTVFTAAKNVAYPLFYNYAYSDGLNESRKPGTLKLGNHAQLGREDFVMTIGVGSDTALPMAWTEETLDATRLRWGYSLDAGDGYMRCDDAFIQSVYDDGFAVKHTTLKARLGQRYETFKDGV